MNYFIDSPDGHRGNDNEHKEKQSGQVVLITLLILVIVLTVGLSIIARSVTDVKTSQQSQESARAFWVAQGGLEKAIRANSTLLRGTGDISYEVTRSALGGGTEYVYPETLKADTPATIWFVGHNTDGSINELAGSFTNPQKVTLYWGDSLSNTTAVEVTFVYREAGGDEYKLIRKAFDPGNTNLSNFTPANTGNHPIGGHDFAFSSPQITLPGDPKMYFARVKFMGNTVADSLAIKINVGQPLPSQGSCFVSTSVVQVSGITKKLTSCQLWNVYPAIFDNALFSGTSI